MQIIWAEHIFSFFAFHHFIEILMDTSESYMTQCPNLLLKFTFVRCSSTCWENMMNEVHWVGGCLYFSAGQHSEVLLVCSVNWILASKCISYLKSLLTKFVGFSPTIINRRASNLSKRIKTKQTKMKIVFINTELFPVVKSEKDF